MTAIFPIGNPSRRSCAGAADALALVADAPLPEQMREAYAATLRSRTPS